MKLIEVAPGQWLNPDHVAGVFADDNGRKCYVAIGASTAAVITASAAEVIAKLVDAR